MESRKGFETELEFYKQKVQHFEWIEEAKNRMVEEYIKSQKNEAPPKWEKKEFFIKCPHDTKRRIRDSSLYDDFRMVIKGNVCDFCYLALRRDNL